MKIKIANVRNIMISCLILIFFLPACLANNYTVLNANEYQKNVAESRTKISKIIKQLQAHHNEDINTRVAFIIKQLTDIPYIEANGMGEGDWQPTSWTYQPNNVHVQQNPVYRLDGLNCQTFIQIIMALLHANNIAQFDTNLLKIAYGAAGNPHKEIVRYYNRNHFVDGDFNPINQQNGRLIDVTSHGVLSPFTKNIIATITRQKWFLHQQQNLFETVKVLHDVDGEAMVKRFMTSYSVLNFPHFDSQSITMSYLPKNILAVRKEDGSFKPNQILLDKIPTPALVEIVRDPKKWEQYGANVKKSLGTELTVSHLGLLHRETFKRNDLIYRRINCAYENSQKICHVTPVICQKEQCKELLFSHATDAYPINYFWYKKNNGEYTCSSQRPENGSYTYCNRVTTLPLFDYLTTYQMGSYWNMESPSILGVHIEKLN